MNSHVINVLGREVRVKSETSPEMVQEVEEFVNRKLADISVSVKGGDTQLVAILALMNIAEEFLSLSKEQSSGELVGRLHKLLAKVDNHL